MTDDAKQALIERIAREVLKRLRAEPSAPNRPRVAAALSSTARESAVRTLREIAEGGYEIAQIACGARLAPPIREAARALGVPFVGESAGNPLAADVRAVIAPDLWITDAAKLAQGILDDPAAEILWAGLAGGIPVLASPGEGFSPSLPNPLRRAAEGHRSACLRLGLQWEGTDALRSALAARVASGEAAATVHVPKAKRGVLITEAMVADLAEGTQEIVLPAGAILTPLARDAARSRGIRLRRRD